MAKVTPGSLIFAIIFLSAAFMLLEGPIAYYTSPQTANTLNETQANISSAFYSSVYNPTYKAAFNDSGGFKASTVLQSFTGLAFMFGDFFQVMSATIQAPNMLMSSFSWLVYYSPLPAVDIGALLALFIGGIVFAVIWFGITSWTKVEGD